MDKLTGRTLASRYRLVALIGKGGFATVYRGVRVEDATEVAVKVLDPKHAIQRDVVRRFRREARAASRLSNPNTVRILDHGVDEGLAFIVMELVRGRDLFEVLTKEGRLDEARAARLMTQVCDALTAAHAEGIVHRDLKPENIMLVDDPTAPGGELVKVLDFGIAKILDRDPPPVDPEVEGPPSAQSDISQVGSLMGTPHYVSPELGRAEPIDGRSDLYTCGVLLYQLVTGRLPFEGETPLQVVMRHVNEQPKPLSVFVPRVSSRLEGVVMRALAKQPADRQQTAEELRSDLEALAGDLARTPLPSLVPPAPPKPARAIRLSPTEIGPVEPPSFPTLPLHLSLDSPGSDEMRLPKPAPMPALATPRGVQIETREDGPAARDAGLAAPRLPELPVVVPRASLPAPPRAETGKWIALAVGLLGLAIALLLLLR